MKEEVRPHIIWVSVLIASVALPLVRTSANDNKPHSRQKRLLWLTTDGRLALPPGTTLVITPTLGLPFVRYPPDGFLSNMTISLPFTIQFDRLGLTDNQNPYGILPPSFERSMGRAAGVMVADYIAQLINNRRSKREIPKAPPQANFHGGERALLYTVVEDFLSNFGMDGKACLLRAICEVHGHKMENFGLLGEVLELFFTASRSPFAEILHEYVEAEKMGIRNGECWKYYKSCSKSLFMWKQENKYREHMTPSPFSKSNSACGWHGLTPERICWWNEVCKEEFQAQFKCKCPSWSFCRSPGRYYNAFCSVAETGYIWTQPAAHWGATTGNP